MKAIPGFNAESSLYRTNRAHLFQWRQADLHNGQQVIPQRDTGVPGRTPQCVVWYYYDVNYPGAFVPIRICW